MQIFFGSKRHGDDVARVYLEECVADLGRESAPHEWITHFMLERDETIAGQMVLGAVLIIRGYAYYPSLATAERAARCFLETASLVYAKKIKPLETETFRPEF